MTDEQVRIQLDALERVSRYLSNSPREVVLQFFADAGIPLRDIRKKKNKKNE